MYPEYSVVMEEIRRYSKFRLLIGAITQEKKSTNEKKSKTKTSAWVRSDGRTASTKCIVVRGDRQIRKED